MKASTLPVKNTQRVRASRRASTQRLASERVYRLVNQFEARLQSTSRARATKVELAPTTELKSPSPADGDIMALAFLVMMASAKSAREDLKAIMSQIKAINDAKQAWREAMGIANKAAAADSDALFQLLATFYIDGVTSEVDAIRGDLDSMSEMGEMESLRLQMAMDRLSKLMSTLSNLLKRLACTASKITQNLK
jgi:hypothetical protein